MLNRNRIIRISLFAAAVIIALLLLPNTSDSKFTFEVNRPWGHSLLTAPFDIPVYRDSTTIRQMRDSIDQTFMPVLKRDNTDSKALLRSMLAIEGISPELRNKLRNSVEKLYNDGIVPTETYNDIKRRKLADVRLLNNNSIDRISTANLRSPRVAYAMLDSMFNQAAARKAMTEMQLANMLTPNMTIDTVVSSQLYNERLQQIEAAIGVIQQGERIIDRGDRVTPQLYAILSTYTQMLDSRDYTDTRGGFSIFIGQALFVIMLFGTLYIFLKQFRPNLFNDVNSLAAIMMAIMGLYIIANIVSPYISSGIYLIPFAILPIMLMVFFDSRTAQFGLIIEVILCSPLATSPFEFIYLQIIAGMASIFTLGELTRRSQLLRTALIVFIVYSVTYIAVELMQSGAITGSAWRLIGYFAINAVLISFAYVLIFVFEKLFGLTSMVTLVELSDINNPVLRLLSEECPGTFQHSMSVSNLASDAARKINANALIVRAGALYHDIGKTANPAFFTENQHGVNPHDSLDPVKSAGIIIGHIQQGLKIAEKEKFPQVLRDMISQHHGKGVAKYFYTTYCRNHPDENVDPAPFTYPGPNPQSREASLLMMADSVEAASRSLKEYSMESISELVNRIIDSQINDGLHAESSLSFNDIKMIKEAFIQRLRTIYHVRIAYPK